MTRPILELKNISRHYSSGDTVVRALDGVLGSQDVNICR